MDWFRRGLPTMGLSVVLGILAWFVAMQLLAKTELDISADASLPPQNADRAASLTTAPSFPPLSQFSQIVERPVFEQARRAAKPKPARTESRPPAIDQGAAPGVAETKLEATLTGIIRSADGDIAILDVVGQSEPVKLQPGEAFRGWSLTDVDADTVTLSGEGHVIRLPLTFRGEANGP